MNLGACTPIRKIAQGGIADIYLAKAKNTAGKEKYLICKCIKEPAAHDDAFLDSIIHEAQFSTRLHHPNIVRIFDIRSEDGQPFLIMEYLDALDLHQLMVQNNQDGVTVPYDLAIYAIGEVANGLNAAHEMTDARGNPQNLVHRDVSPENVMFGSNGDIKLGDFGIAKTATMPDLTPTDTIKGKFNYMSPEHAWGDKLDRRADLFSLAIILYEAITGASFYPTNNVAATIDCARIATYRPPHEIVPDFPDDLERVLAKALDLDKKLRYPTVLEFRMALEECAARHGWAATRESWAAYVRERLNIQKMSFPLMRAEEFPSSSTSLLKNVKPETPPAPDIEDTDATARILPDALQSIIQAPEKIHSSNDLIRASTEALRRSAARMAPIQGSLPERPDEDEDSTLQCTRPEFEKLVRECAENLHDSAENHDTVEEHRVDVGALKDDATTTPKHRNWGYLAAIVALCILIAVLAFLLIR